MATQPEKYTEVFPLRTTTKMYREIKAAAQKEYLTISQYVRKVLREALEK